MTTTDSRTDGNSSLAQVIECLLFAAGEPLGVKELAKVTESDETDVHEAVRFLRDQYLQADSGLQVIEIAGGYQMGTRPEFAPMVGKMLAPHANRLSRPALETVTIVAYRQPCTQIEIEAIRGVASDGVLKTLLERELIKEAGRKQTPGRPILYATTDGFLHYFGLAGLEDLPILEEDELPIGTSAEEIADETRTALAAAGVEG
jgi:segregation and condensation protein B